MTTTTKMTVESATGANAAAIAAVRLAASRDMANRFGSGPWSFSLGSEGAVRAELISSTILIARDEGRLLGTLRLSTQNPWLGDTAFFTACSRPIYLTSMAVAPKHQRQGFGRRLIEAALHAVTVDLRGEAIRLDSFDARAGAGDFYRKCGFNVVWQAGYNGTPLIWFERILKADCPGPFASVAREADVLSATTGVYEKKAPRSEGRERAAAPARWS